MRTITNVKALDNYKLLLEFDNIEKREFDMIEYLDHGDFVSLKNTVLFNSVHISFDSIQWENGLDLCPEILFSKSYKV